MTDCTPDTLRVLKAIGPWVQTDVLELYADAWDDDILRQDVYDENYRKELDKNNALRQRLEAAKKLLGRLYRWDHMDTAADGTYWRSEIAAYLAAGEKP